MIEDDGRHLTMFVIYENPTDVPGDGFVVRRWVMCAHDNGHAPVPDPMVAVGQTLEAARSQIPPGLFCLQRQENDDPCIREVWL